MVSTRRFLFIFVATLCCATAYAQNSADVERDLRHATVEWQNIAPHLPDAQTGKAADLEVAADVLRARRLPEDALDYYRYAMARGGDRPRLYNRIGVTELELRRSTAANMAFRQAIALDRRNADAWNNLGATEYQQGNLHAAVMDYTKALKINAKDATFHSNLGMAYFEQKDFESARRQFASAVALDPEVFHRGGWGGVDAHVMSPSDRGRFCVELARLAAGHGNQDAMLLWLSRASEAGYDIRPDLKTMPELMPYERDTRVLLLMKNAKAMRAGQLATAGQGPVPTLPEGTVRKE